MGADSPLRQWKRPDRTPVGELRSRALRPAAGDAFAPPPQRRSVRAGRPTCDERAMAAHGRVRSPIAGRASTRLSAGGICSAATGPCAALILTSERLGSRHLKKRCPRSPESAPTRRRASTFERTRGRLRADDGPPVRGRPAARRRWRHCSRPRRFLVAHRVLTDAANRVGVSFVDRRRQGPCRLSRLVTSPFTVRDREQRIGRAEARHYSCITAAAGTGTRRAPPGAAG